jgi:hypothetical protein
MFKTLEPSFASGKRYAGWWVDGGDSP